MKLDPKAQATMAKQRNEIARLTQRCEAQFEALQDIKRKRDFLAGQVDRLTAENEALRRELERATA